MSTVVRVEEPAELGARVFVRHGMTPENADCVGEVVAAAERDGSTSHGLLPPSGYVLTFQNGWVDGKAVPVVSDVAPGLIATDAANGFAQPALRASAHCCAKRRGRKG
jgi:delta1-piperideine-2-carboxylate reductase